MCITNYMLRMCVCVCVCMDFPGGWVLKNLHANAGGARDAGWIPGLGIVP